MLEFIIGGGVLIIIVRALYGKSRSQQKRRRSSTEDRSTSCKTASNQRRSGQRVQKHRKWATNSTPPGLKLETTLTGKCYVVDGDTIQIGKVRLRLAGIDAPELEHPWGKKAKWELVKLCKGNTITAKFEPDISYDRVVATCYLPDGRDLSAEMVRIGLALDWPKFSAGKYTHLEPEGIRKKHWKAAARQRGHMHIFNK